MYADLPLQTTATPSDVALSNGVIHALDAPLLPLFAIDVLSALNLTASNATAATSTVQVVSAPAGMSRHMPTFMSDTRAGAVATATGGLPFAVDVSVI